MASLFRLRAFNMDSLTVEAAKPRHLRMTIVVDTRRCPPISRRTCGKLIPVVEVTDVTPADGGPRLALIRACAPPTAGARAWSTSFGADRGRGGL